MCEWRTLLCQSAFSLVIPAVMFSRHGTPATCHPREVEGIETGNENILTFLSEERTLT